MAQKIPFEDVLNLENGKETYDEIMGLAPVMERFGRFMMVKSLGIKVDVKDFSYYDMQVFSILHGEIKSRSRDQSMRDKNGR